MDLLSCRTRKLALLLCLAVPTTAAGFVHRAASAPHQSLLYSLGRVSRCGSMAMSAKPDIVVDRFCLRQFSPVYAGARIEMEPKVFEDKINQLYRDGLELHDGYAPFCKHLFVKNFAELTSGTVEITPDNEAHLQTVYEARTDKELPVLIRYFPKEMVPPKQASYLDIILYSREQIRRENEAMGDGDLNNAIDAPWGVVSVKPQDVDRELPMQPITMFRNSLGREFGGSGVPLDREAYMESVAFWAKHAIIR